MISLPAAVLLGVATAAVLADALARRRDAKGDSGGLWAPLAARFAVPFFPLLLVSGWVEALLPQVWARGHHLHADRTGAFGHSPQEVYPWVLLAPAVVWLLLLVGALLLGPRPRREARWLAGSAGLGSSRAWVALAALPLLVAVATQTRHLGGGTAAYPAAAWSSLVVFSVTLLALAAGRSRPVPTARRAQRSVLPATPPRRWFEELGARGLELTPPIRVPAEASPSPEEDGPRSGGEGSELARHLARLGRRGIAPEWAVAFDRLLDPLAEPSSRRALIFAPDDCGQIETVAGAAVLLQRRYLETTLVVARGGAVPLARRLERFLDGSKAAVPTAEQPLPSAPLWVVDAEILSDILLPRLRSAPEAVRSLGLVVWWQLHEFSGIYGANLWVLSRRLRRVIRRAAGDEVRTAALLRPARVSGDQVEDFVRRVLPYDFATVTKTYVPLRMARHLHLYRLVSQEGLFARGDGLDMPDQFRHPALVLARESARLGWPTFVEMPPEIPEAARAAVEELPAGDRPLRRTLTAEAAEAGASVRHLAAADALSVGERFASSGRAATAGEHHLVITPPANPYVGFLLDQLDGRLQPQGEGVLGSAARRLMCAEGDERLLRRHLLLALNERPDTREGLQRDFRRDDAAIRRTLDRLAETDALTRREVRSLDQRGRLVIDHRFASREAVDDSHRPLDTVGSRLVEVVDPAAGHDPDRGVRLRVDPERATVLAYPGRIFSSAGGRYEVQAWHSLDRVAERGFAECRGVDGHAVTWRRRLVAVHDIECPRPGVSVTGGRGAAVTLLEAPRMVYEETVLGVYRWRVRRLGRGAGELESRRFERPLFGSFETRGLLVLIDEPCERASLVALCAALGPPLTVLLGLEDNVLEPVPIDGVMVRGRAAHGLAFVELFPGGIGVLDALHDADRVLLDLFARTHAWLSACPCQDETGCERCLRSPSALAASGDTRPRRAEALRWLAHLGGPP